MKTAETRSLSVYITCLFGSLLTYYFAVCCAEGLFHRLVIKSHNLVSSVGPYSFIPELESLYLHLC